MHWLPGPGKPRGSLSFLHNRKLLSSSERSAISRGALPGGEFNGYPANLGRFEPRKLIAHPAKKM
jgi:hypothetical protein